MIRLTDRPEDIAQAARLLARGELVAFPTETVYGLGAHARDPDAVRRVFEAKGRPVDHPLIVHLLSAEALEDWAADVPADALRLADAFWPGPLTLVLPKHPSVPGEVTGGQATVALRVPAHPAALALLEASGEGLVAPSANRFGRVSPTRPAHVEAELGDRVAAIIDGGACRVGLESTILDLSGSAPRILRPGMLGAERLGAVLGRVPAAAARGEGPRASGRLTAHYATATPLEVVPAADLRKQVAATPGAVAVLTFGAEEEPAPGVAVWDLLPPDPVTCAQVLYARLRELDGAGHDRILVVAPPEGPAWTAITDRLCRAAAGAEVYDG